MSKVGRNDPCPCGSGQKYKKCCAAKDAAAEAERLAPLKARMQAQEAEYRAQLNVTRESYTAQREAYHEVAKFTEESNAVLDLINAGQLDEAEAAAHALLENYPHMHDGYTRLGKVFEARGDRLQAAHWYRRSVEFMRAHPDRHEPEYIDIIEERVRTFEV